MAVRLRIEDEASTASESLLRFTAGNGEEQTIPTCRMCREQFTLEPAHKEVLRKCLLVHSVLEWDNLEMWHDISGVYGRGDYVGVTSLQCVSNEFDKAERLCDLRLECVGALSGSVHICLACAAFGPSERKPVNAVLSWLGEWHQHVWHRHQERDGVGIPCDLITNALQPRYVGQVTLEDACRVQPTVAGLSINDLAEKLAEQREQTLVHYREHPETAHGGKPDTQGMFETALWNSVNVVAAEGAQWRAAISEAEDSATVCGVSSTVHAQIFLIDELLRQQVWAGSMSCNGSISLYNAVEAVANLIDWDQCPHLRRFCDAYREHKSRRKHGDFIDW